MSAARETALRAYFIEVIQDLIVRGTVRRWSGQSVDDVIRAEAGQLFRGVAEDLKNAAAKLGVSFAEIVMRSAGGAIFDMLRKR